MKWYAVYVTGGVVQQVKEIPQQFKSDEFYCVQAPDEAKARTLGYNAYCYRKKKLAIARLEAEGKCRCGRDNDRIGTFRTCSVCSVRHTAAIRRERAGKPRDEEARVESNLGRQRDRKNEMRLEVLVEVQKVWVNTRITSQFSLWLKEQIEKAVKPRKHSE